MVLWSFSVRCPRFADRLRLRCVCLRKARHGGDLRSAGRGLRVAGLTVECAARGLRRCQVVLQRDGKFPKRTAAGLRRFCKDVVGEGGRTSMKSPTCTHCSSASRRRRPVPGCWRWPQARGDAGDLETGRREATATVHNNGRRALGPADGSPGAVGRERGFTS